MNIDKNTGYKTVLEHSKRGIHCHADEGGEPA